MNDWQQAFNINQRITIPESAVTPTEEAANMSRDDRDRDRYIPPRLSAQFDSEAARGQHIRDYQRLMSQLRGDPVGDLVEEGEARRRHDEDYRAVMRQMGIDTERES